MIIRVYNKGFVIDVVNWKTKGLYMSGENGITKKIIHAFKFVYVKEMESWKRAGLAMSGESGNTKQMIRAGWL